MANSIFRQKSIDKVSSPEELNDYIRVSNPSVWMLLSGIIILLIGICVWGIFGHLQTVIRTGAVCHDGVLTCYIKESDIQTVQLGMCISINGVEYPISSVSPVPQELDADTDSYVLHVGDFAPGDWAYTVSASASAEDGAYEAVIVTESVSPMSFILN